MGQTAMTSPTEGVVTRLNLELDPALVLRIEPLFGVSTKGFDRG